MCHYYNFIPSLQLNLWLKILQYPAEKDLPFLANLYCTKFINCQIYAYNLKGPAKKDLLYKPNNLKWGFISL